MNLEAFESVYQRLKNKEIDEITFQKELIQHSFTSLLNSTIDDARENRTGFAEIVFALKKSVKQLEAIIPHIFEKHGAVLVTRLSAEKQSKLRSNLNFNNSKHQYYADCESLVICNNSHQAKPLRGSIAIVSAGTSDYKVALEAKIVAEFLGAKVEMIEDVGVAGLNRLIAHREAIENSTIAICIAGMEGALPSALAGLVSTPIIAVPTSVGYGANLGGVATLLAMINSCASGISIVNIDNGFGAAYQACLFLRKISES